MYVNPPSDTWTPATWADLGIAQFEPCLLRGQILRTSLMSSETARSYFAGDRDDLINIVNEEGYAEVSLISPPDIFTELEEPFEVHKCVFDGGFFHLKRTIEETEYQGISNCPWFAFNPKDIVLILYNKNQATTLEDRLIIVGHSQFDGDNNLDDFITLPPRSGFSGDYYTNYEDDESETVNCFLGIRDNYLIKYDIPYADYEMTDDDHGSCTPLSWNAALSRWSVDYPHGILIQTSLRCTNVGASGSRLFWVIRWYGPRQFHTINYALVYEDFNGVDYIDLSTNLIEYPYIMTTVDGTMWARMFDYGSSCDVLIGEQELDDDGFITDVTLTVETLSEEASALGTTWPVALKSDASGIVWSTDSGDLVVPSEVEYERIIYIEGMEWIASSWNEIYSYFGAWGGQYRACTGLQYRFLYINLDADMYVYVVEEYNDDDVEYQTGGTYPVTPLSPIPTAVKTVYFRQGSVEVELSTWTGTWEIKTGYGYPTQETNCALMVKYIGNIPYLCLDYVNIDHGVKHMCDVTNNDRGDIVFLTAPVAEDLVLPATSPYILPFSYATRENYVIVDGELLADPIDLETFDYLDLT